MCSAGKALLQLHSALFWFFGISLETAATPDLFFTCLIGNSSAERRGLIKLRGFLFNCAKKDKASGLQTQETVAHFIS